ncbi:hypothetical protein NPIL_676691 [Nephila pilipes]|uniref:Uncharacterized protein n=1 Tax=Nephila pilipes TaxID=299642 RepID=A0A8X6MR55_NEPPI|nr:hypothetical protein NPIL_676691 [Nephila pilipes]
MGGKGVMMRREGGRRRKKRLLVMALGDEKRFTVLCVKPISIPDELLCGRFPRDWSPNLWGEDAAYWDVLPAFPSHLYGALSFQIEIKYFPTYFFLKKVLRYSLISCAIHVTKIFGSDSSHFLDHSRN